MTGKKKKTPCVYYLVFFLSVANSLIWFSNLMISIPLLLKVERFYLITCVITWSWWIKLVMPHIFFSVHFLTSISWALAEMMSQRVNPYFSCHFQKEIACASLVPGSKRCVDGSSFRKETHFNCTARDKTVFLDQL